MLANTGIPMLGVQLVYLTIVLAPVIGIEALVFRKRLQLNWGESFASASIANLISTFVGFPIAWVAFVAIQLSVGGGSAWGLDTFPHRLAAVTIQAPWLIPYEKELYWMIPAASLALLIPCFPISVLIERMVLRRRLVAIDRRQLSFAIWIANGLTYLLLILLGIFQLWFVLNRHD